MKSGQYILLQKAIYWHVNFMKLVWMSLKQSPKLCMDYMQIFGELVLSK